MYPPPLHLVHDGFFRVVVGHHAYVEVSDQLVVQAPENVKLGPDLPSLCVCVCVCVCVLAFV
jgi:hypothetical protein